MAGKNLVMISPHLPGWLAGSFQSPAIRMSAPVRTALAALLILLATGGLLPLKGQSPVSAVPPNEVIARMEESNKARQVALQSYRNLRRYEAMNTRLNRQASVIVEMMFTAPDDKTFRVLESNGSRTIQKRVINPLLDSERETSVRKERTDVDITRQNYIFTYVGTDPANGALIFTVEPRKANKYLFRGKLWIDAGTFGIMRIEGEPAKSPSFWIKKTHFVHEYARFGDFWFPVSNRTEAEVRIFGTSKLSIDYFGYQWQPSQLARLK